MHTFILCCSKHSIGQQTHRNISLHIMLLHRTLTPTWTRALTRPVIRRGIQPKYKQPFVAQSEVTCTLCPLALDQSAALPLPSQDRALDASVLLDDTIPKSWLYARVNHELTVTQTNIDSMELTKHRHGGNVMRPHALIHACHISTRSRSLFSLPPSCRIVALVNLCSLHNPKKSSKVPLAAV